MPLNKILFLTALGFWINTEAYAQSVEQCEAEIGINVPEFDCDDGTLVPTTINGEVFDSYDEGTISEYRSLKCDRPNVLNGKCDPGSKFQVLMNTPDAYLVAHCRRKGSAEGVYGDIAMIQHNKVNGATCFYQSDTFSEREGPKNNIVKAPKTGQSIAPHVKNGCMSCHDNGPLIRTPYLTQVTTGKNVIPGAGDNTFNKDQPYYIVGNESAKSYSVSVQGNKCTSCHSLSIWKNGNSAFGINSAGSLALSATKQFQSNKLPTSNSAPMWMSLTGTNSSTYNPFAYAAAQEIYECAKSANNSASLPNSDRCQISEKLGRLRKPLSLISGAGQCLDIHSGYYNNGDDEVPILSYECYAENINQKWTYTEQRTIVSEDGHCLNATGASNGSAVTAINCNNSIQQRWEYNSYTGALTNDSAPGKCLDMYNTNSMESGQRIQMWACNGYLVQRWAMADLKYQYLQNNSIESKSLNIQNQNGDVSQLASGAILPGWFSAQWSVERVGGSYRIRNKWKKNEFLHIQNEVIESGEIEPYWLSSLWILHGQPALGANVYTIQSKWKPSLYLSLNSAGAIQIATKEEASEDSIYWNMKDVNPI